MSWVTMEPSKNRLHFFILLSLLIISTTTTTNSMPDQQQVDFLEAHNRARLQAGVPPLTWDPKLADFARNWANKQAAACQMVHSNGPYGENLWWGGAGYPWTPNHAVTNWVKEERFFDKVKNTCVTGQQCYHYTQIMWRDTTKVGCVQIQCNNGDAYTVCEYDPPGNFEGLSPFEKHDSSIYIDSVLAPPSNK